MASIDKAAIGWSIAIVAAGVAIAFAGQSGQNLGVSMDMPSSPIPSPTVEPKPTETRTDPFADIAAKVKEETSTKPKVEEKPVESTMPVPAPEPTPEPVEEMVVEPSGAKTVTVEIPSGTSVPGCEETNECFIPATVTINVGDTVTWHNADTAAHTVTAGSPTDGPSGVFDSSLVMGGNAFSNTFDEAGSYDYFCMVHPWMKGIVQVN